MAGLTRLQVTAGLGAMVSGPCEPLPAWPKRPVGFDAQIPPGELRMALLTKFHVVAALAVLRIINRLDGMDIDPVAPVAPWLVVAAKVLYGQVFSRTAARVAIEAELLLVALATVFLRLACQDPVNSHPV